MLARILEAIPDKPPAEPLPERVLEYLRQNRIPEDVIADLQAASYSDWIQIKTLTLIPMPQLIEQTEMIWDCMKNGYLPVAGGANGDPVVMHRDTRRMFFVSHDTLWDEDWKDFRECIQETPYLYEEFWDRLMTDANFPWDYYDAQRLWGQA